jgi:predicted nucleic acid-binding protein
VSLVLDASATLAWVYQDEITETAQEILDRVMADGAWVPALWRLEVANALNIGIRRRRIDASYRDEALATLALHDIKVDPETWQHAWGTTLRLADQFGLTPYDAAYVELAQRRSLPLAALDGEMRIAAQSLGLVLIGA